MLIYGSIKNIKSAQDKILCRFAMLKPNYFACSKARVTVVMSQTSAGP